MCIRDRYYTLSDYTSVCSMHTAAELDAKAGGNLEDHGNFLTRYGTQHRFEHCLGGKDLMEAENEVEKLKKKGKPVPKQLADLVEKLQHGYYRKQGMQHRPTANPIQWEIHNNIKADVGTAPPRWEGDEQLGFSVGGATIRFPGVN